MPAGCVTDGRYEPRRMSAAPRSIDGALDAGMTILVDSGAVARHVRRYAAARYDREGTWSTPAVTTLDGFVEALWRERRFGSDLPAPVRLSALQAEALWAAVGGGAIGEYTGTALSRARRRYLEFAAGTGSEFGTGPKALGRYLRHGGDERLRAYFQAFEAALAERGAIDAAAALVLAPGWIAEARWLPDAVLFAVARTPAARRIARALAARGVAVHDPAPAPAAPDLTTFRAAEFDREIRAAAAWAAEAVAAEGVRQRWRAPVTIAVTDLAGRAARVSARVSDVLGPPGSDTWAASSGVRPESTRVVKDAFALLEARRSRLDFTTVCAIARSVHHGADDAERRRWLALEPRLRADGQAAIARRRLTGVLRKGGSDGSDVLVRALEAAEIFSEAPSRRRAGAWMAMLGAWLDGVGWPGPEAALDDLARAAVDGFREAVAALAALDPILDPMSFDEAMRWLRRGLARVPAIQRDAAAAPVLLADVGEIALPVFPALWVAGLTERAWPPPAAPDALLPAGLQRDLGMVTPAGADALASPRHLSETFVGGPGTRRLSYAELEDDQPERPSPLIAAFVDAIPLPAPGPGQDPEPLEVVVDEYGPGLVRSGPVAGGAGLIERQANCPFQAFARHRLGASADPDPEAGLDAGTRGTFVHEVLERVYRRLPGAKALAAADHAARCRVVLEAMAESASALERGTGDAYRRAMVAVERDRVLDLVIEWLDFDAGREGFEVVATEQRRRVVVGGLDLELRADRVDRLEDGRLAVIDYKTGRTSGNDWTRARLSAPQLPLYAVTHEEAVAAIAFATLRPGECALTMLADPEAPVIAERGRSVADDLEWADRLAYWREALERFAGEFTSGFARVAPESDVVCQRCRLEALCRVRSLARGHGSGDRR